MQKPLFLSSTLNCAFLVFKPAYFVTIAYSKLEKVD